MIKLRDIAEAAGTSIATVSKVINHYPGIHEDTRKRVLDAIKRMGYVPNASARQLSTKRSFVVGVVFTENLDVGLEHPFYGGVIEGFRNRMNAMNYDVMFISTAAADQKMSYLEHCRYRQVDGVFVCTFAGDDHALYELFDSDVPCVTTDVDYPGTPLITSDNRQSIEAAYAYLYGLGHRRILHIQGPMDTLAARERSEAFIRTHGDHQRVKPLLCQAGDFNYDSGYAAMRDYMNEHGTSVDAVIASSDIIALGAIQAIREKGLGVPEAISVIGVDDIALAQISDPPLTTMAQDRRGLGRLVADSLVKRMAGGKLPSRTCLPMNLIERATCRAKYGK